MLKRVAVVCLIGLICFSLIPLSILMDQKSQSDLQVQDGVMDLAGWDYEHDTRIKLDGQWEFYWNKLLPPDQFRQGAAKQPVPSAYMKVPSVWNGKIVDETPLPAHGSATYRMVLKNVPIDGIFALKKTNIRFSSAVYANGRLLFADGKPAEQAADYEPGNISQVGTFASGKGDVEIIVHVSNYDYINAGIPMSLYFGEQAAMFDFQQKSKARELSIFAILVTLALIYVICFATAAHYRIKDYNLLFFALICLLYAMYSGMIGERSLLMYIDGISFEVLFKLKDILSFACFIVLAIFFYQLKRNIISLKITQAVTVVLGGYIVFVALLPISAYMSVQMYVIALYEALTIWLLLRISMLYFKSVENERLKSFLLYVAILCFALYSIDMILFSFSLKESMWLGQFYIVAFNVMMIFLIVLRFFEAYHTIDDMKNRLLQMDKIKDEFLSNTSHELKTPLNAIVNITDTLLKGVGGSVNEQQAQNLAIVMDSGRRLSQLVNELLDYSKMKHGDIALYTSSVDLKSVVDSVVRMHSFLLGGKAVALVNEVGDNLPALYADADRLVQIMHNLIGNAIKFTDSGTVAIRAVVIKNKVEVTVEDTGIGIAAHMHERIFEAFEQADGSETRNYGGTGLGLSITKKLVELQGGEIRVDSSPGQGAAFTFTLPIADTALTANVVPADGATLSAQEASAASAYPIYIQGEKNELVLVVDDDFANLQTMINLLKLDGYSIVVVNRGRLALDELAKNNDFYLVVLDLMMPDMSGYEVLRKLRERFSPADLPVLMLTARNRVADTILSMENGANDFVGKPFESEELLARVRSLTRMKASVKNAKDAEIAFLRSQIKPHFLYNALNSIAALCPDEPGQAEALTLQLSQYLRSSFDFKQLDSYTTLEQEIELVQAYVNIEKARFGARLQIEYALNADRTIRIPPLILQPLVENAIRHGLMSNLRGGTIKVAVHQPARNVVSFAVEDDGCGMSEQKRQEVLAPDNSKQGVGLWNINQRIKLLYGESLHIETAEGKGTKIGRAHV